jgi:hypothetical protein
MSIPVFLLICSFLQAALLFYNSLNDSVSKSVVLNDWMRVKQKDVKGSGYDLIYDTIPPFALTAEENHKNPESG